MRFLCLLLVPFTLFACAASSQDPEDVEESHDALMRGGLGATGDSCTIDLPDGLKEPGTRDANGSCCSTLHAGKCQDSKGTITGGYSRFFLR